MAGTTLGQGKGPGTIYSGPGPVGSIGPGAGGTVYSGPSTGGTVYNGPAASGAAAPTAAGRTQPSVGGGAVRGARIFFAIAAFTAINVVLIFAGIRFAIGLGATRIAGPSLGSFVVVSLLGAAVFAALGILAKNGSKPAFLIGMLLYGGDLVLLVLTNPALHIISIVIHGLFLFYLITAFRQLD
jgi:hypothetical protein